MSFGIFADRDADLLVAGSWDVQRVGGTLDEVRRALESAEWLGAHPELHRASDWQGYPWSLRTVRSDAQTTFCLTDREAEPPQRWCWERTTPAEDFRLSIHYDGDAPRDDDAPYVPTPRPGSLVLAVPNGARLDRWVLRFPEATIATASAAAMEPREHDVRPPWWHTRSGRVAGSDRVPRSRDPSPLQLIAEPDLGPLGSRRLSMVAGDVDALNVEWPWGEQTRAFAEHALTFCARVDASWRCAAPTGVSDAFQAYGYTDFALFARAADGSRLALAHRAWMGVGGSGEYSGDTGRWDAELFRIEPGRLERLGVLQLGAMEWVTLRHGEMGRYYRLVAQQHVTAAPRGARCLAIGRRYASFGEAGASFEPHGRQRNADPALPVSEVLDEVELNPLGDGVPVGATLPPRPPGEVPGRLWAPALAWTGLWQIEENHRLRRLSTNPDDPTATTTCGLLANAPSADAASDDVAAR